MIENTVKNTIKEYGLINKKDKVMLGVSGGQDSMCLLYLFHGLREEFAAKRPASSLQLVCVHFNHSLRKEADREESFVKDVCKKLKIKFISDKKDVKSFYKGDSLEQTARNLRLEFFLKCFRQTKIKKIALAHHKDDLVETILMRIIRGTGLKGLRGFSPNSKFRGLNIIRPLIGVNKEDVLQWLKKKKIAYCIDKSNFEDKFFRNNLRLNLMPVLRKLNPCVEDNVYNLARNLSLDYDFIYTFSYNKFQELKRSENKRDVRLDLEGLKKLSQAVFNNVIRVAIEEAKGNLRKIEGRHLSEIRDLVFNRPRGSIVDLPDLFVKKEEKLLIIQTLIL
ncbi:MAG: tRNA lysidine(34) synthetase TilS [Candidatus Omnitrophota bacterium]|nr:tRNA lysidine(34) synthetase TilS [Candidatus Omnitrophota bacterium]